MSSVNSHVRHASGLSPDLTKLRHMAAFPPPGEAKKRRALLKDTVHAHLAKAVKRDRAARLSVEGRV